MLDMVSWFPQVPFIFFSDVEVGKLMYYIPKTPLQPVFCDKSGFAT